ncbi:MAG: hypothetical protein K2Q15_04955 [Burkholderiales bacterium]|nr:hypothetical protein [Burkholderiales bacterium]
MQDARIKTLKGMGALGAYVQQYITGEAGIKTITNQYVIGGSCRRSEKKANG